MPIASVGNVELCYSRRGRGPAVLFLSGLTGGQEGWMPVVELLAPNFECIMMDYRGNAGSSKPETGYSIPILADDAAGLLEALGIARASLVGVSLGGLVAMQMVSTRPALVQGLVLSGTFAKSSPVMDHIQETRKMMQQYLPPYEFNMVNAAWFLGSDAFARPGFVEQWARERASAAQPQAPHAFVQLADAIRSFDARPLLGSIRAPTLVMCGQHDAMTPVWMSEELAKGIPGAELKLIPGAGHYANVERPAAFAETVAGFLGRVTAR